MAPTSATVITRSMPFSLMSVACDRRRMMCSPWSSVVLPTDWEPQFGPRPSAVETVEICRSILVITGIDPVS